ncbi:carbamate kinase [Schnuerera sp.]|uniref:carbamate kinase n=1 Tax=Schnuerera sp. TaxID=2794844 RepID=UPI002C86F04D|nr:carbamate kinase [Schnuerera sp.]HSH36576.1 carbamate kinase [Schnuerera sp.]
MANRIVVALGGNALQENPKDISAKAQLKTAKKTARSIVDLIEEGHEVVIVHGNGPQVGQIVSVYEKALDIPNMPFPECGAMSQGYIGYHLQQTIREEMIKRGIYKEITAMITQVVVSNNDSAFTKPSKPVGSFFTEEEAIKLEKLYGYTMKEDAGRGWRRVVPSPEPIDIVESQTLKVLVDSNFVVITAGGGGIPVVKRNDGNLEGVSAVIDKDFAAELVGEIIDADMLIILTAVEKVCIDFNKSTEKGLDMITIEEAERYIEEGQFAPGSMLPKVKAAVKFVKSKKGRKAIITSLDKAKECIIGEIGTKIQNDF